MVKMMLWVRQNPNPITLSFTGEMSKKKTENVINYLFEERGNPFEVKSIITDSDYFTIPVKSLLAVYIFKGNKQGSRISVWLNNIPSPLILYTGENLYDLEEIKRLTNDFMLPINNDIHDLKYIRFKNESCFAFRKCDIQSVSVSIHKKTVQLFDSSEKIVEEQKTSLILPKPENDCDAILFDLDDIIDEDEISFENYIIPVKIIYENTFL